MARNDPTPILSGKDERERYLDLMGKLTPSQIKDINRRGKERKKELAEQDE